ncbi:MAG: CDP-diacylglycerol--glycerol-3-phosphate 3-phosphatidyltransferase [Elusimicrobia bacterium]|nr:CDP-diacylglycerol--glycerol-3-phosphate 3-phosphatidyltransferase [Elusimicrobiota bacterium]
MNLANKITFLRILLIVPFVALLMQRSPSARLGAFFVFLTASITDYFDGKIARKRNEVSNSGKFMDPLADKLFVSSALIVLIYLAEAPVPVWAVILIVAREFIINALRTLAASEGRILESVFIGKVKTAFQMIAILVILLLLITGKYLFSVYYIVLLTALLSVYSGVIYILKNRDILDF